MGLHEDVFGAGAEDPETFWLDAAGGIDWDVVPRQALDSSDAPFYRWFPDGRLIVCFNALDRHAQGPFGQTLRRLRRMMPDRTHTTPAEPYNSSLRQLS